MATSDADDDGDDDDDDDDGGAKGADAYDDDDIAADAGTNAGARSASSTVKGIWQPDYNIRFCASGNALSLRMRMFAESPYQHYEPCDASYGSKHHTVAMPVGENIWQ